MWKQAPEQACVERRRTSARSTKAPTSSRCPALAECQRSPKPDSRWKKYSNPCRHVEAPLPPHFNVEPGQTWAWLLQGFDYFFHSPDLSPGSEQHCSRGEGGDKVLKGSNISSIYGPRGGRVCGRLTTAAGLCKMLVEAPVPTGASVLAK